jgi:hypothetical protein
LLLEKIIPEHGVMEDYEVEHEFPQLGTRIMRLNARQFFHKEGAETTILLGIEDVTVRRTLENEKDNLLGMFHLTPPPAKGSIGVTGDSHDPIRPFRSAVP